MTLMNRFIAVTAASLAYVSVVGLQTARGDDWAQWRGPERNGISRETGLLKEWPAAGPPLVWQIKDAGYGFGTPSISNGRIFLMSNAGLDAEFVQARAAATGKLLWSTKVGKVGSPNQMPNYPAARSTPTVVGDLVYALGSDGDLVCVDVVAGKEVWRKNLKADFGGEAGIWAYSESPLVDGDSVICTPGGSQATLVALNRKTGSVVWKSAVPGGGPASYASVTISRIGGVKQYVQFIQKGLIGVDAATGKFLWKFEQTADQKMGGNIATPVASGNNVYSASGLVAAGLTRVEAKNGEFVTEAVYVSRKLPNAIGGSVKVGANLYGATNSVLMCIDYATGVVKWEDRCLGPASICVADGKLIVHGENGDVALVDAAPDGYHERGRFTPADQPSRNRTKAWAYPVVANGKLYIRDLDSLWCYDLRDSKAAK